MRSRTAAVAITAAGALALSACGADVAAGPAGAVQERLDRGVAVEVTIEADPDGLADQSEATELQDLLTRQDQDGPMLVVSRSGDGQARGLVLHGGDLEVRQVEETIYLRADADTLSGLMGGELPEVGDAGVEDGPLALLEGLDGGWIGVSGVTEERLAELLGPDDDDGPADGDMEAIQDLFAERNLDDLEGLFESYATVTGDGPWEVEVNTRDLAAALEQVGMEADALLGDEDGPHDDTSSEDHDLEDLPERVGGITVEATDGVADRIVVDLATVVETLDAAHRDEADGDDQPMDDEADHRADLEALAAVDARLVLTMVDVEDRVDTPVDAAVVDLTLLEAFVGEGADGFLSGLSEPTPGATED